MIFYEEILRAFQKQKVQYLLVGGVAINNLLLRVTLDNLKSINGLGIDCYKG